MKKSLLTFAIGATAMAAPAATFEFTYNPFPEGEQYSAHGYGKKETYDVAIRICDPTLVGTKVTGMRVNVPVEPQCVDNVSAWMSTELKLENKKNAPDITSQPGEISDYMLSVTFDEPYTMTADGVYVGYSFNVTELLDYSKTPIACQPAENPDGLFVHTSRTRLKWTNEAENIPYVSTMVVTLESESGPTDAAAALNPESYAVIGESAEIPLIIINYGSEPMNSLSYSWISESGNGDGEKTLSSPVMPGERATVNVQVGPFASTGLYPLELTVDTFNGMPNNDPRRTASGNLLVMPFMPVTRPLVEEYTGLQCGYCPRGFIAMEEMAEDYGDRFVGLAYHSESYETGCMVVMPNSEFPADVPGFPYATLNRTASMDPSEVPLKWDDAAAAVAPADIETSLEWTDDTESVLRASATLRFAREYENADMSAAIILVADGLTNPKWGQSNYFSGETGHEGPLWEIFTEGGKTVRGLTFNFVVASPNIGGISGSIPSEISLDSEISCSREFNMADILNVKGEEFLSEGSTLHAVAILIDNATGAVLNSSRSAALDSGISKVTDIDASRTVTSTEWYDLRGIRVTGPNPDEILIRVDHLDDGSVRHSRIMVSE